MLDWTAGLRNLGKSFPISHPDFLMQRAGAGPARVGAMERQVRTKQCRLPHPPAGAAMTPAGSPLSLQSAHKDSFVPKRKVRKPALAVTRSAHGSHS